MTTPTTSKRSNESDDSVTKKFKYDEGAAIKHYIIDAENVNYKQVKSLFSSVRIIALHEETKEGKKESHFHVLGEAKFSKRTLRDMSIHSLLHHGIIGGLEIKERFVSNSTKIKNIEGAKHFEHTVQYLKRKDKVLFEDETIQWVGTVSSAFKALDEAMVPSKYDRTEMAEFRRRFPLVNSWKKQVVKANLKSNFIAAFQGMEKQRQYEDSTTPLSVQEVDLLIPNIPLLQHAHNLKLQMQCHDQNSGVCMILCGQALTCKSTLTRIIAQSLGEYSIWPGSQWITKDNLKFDTAARQAISTIVVEEMQWIDLQHRITLEKTLCSIKEQLTGAGLDVRLAKTKSSFQDDIKFKLDFLLISMNENEFVTYKVLAAAINSKPEYKRRFILINMDDPTYDNLQALRNDKQNFWNTNPGKEFINNLLI